MEGKPGAMSGGGTRITEDRDIGLERGVATLARCGQHIEPAFLSETA